jgi:hypothetical protein
MNSPVVRRLSRQHVETRARRAVNERLGHIPAGSVVIEATPGDQGAVTLHTNSGGNAAAIKDALTAAGYRVELRDADFGVLLRISSAVGDGGGTDE